MGGPNRLRRLLIARGFIFRHSLLNLRLVAPIGGLIVFLIDAEIVLFDNSAGEIVSILVISTVAKAFCPLIVRISQMFWDGQGPAVFYIFHGSPDGHGAGVGFGGGCHINSGLAES